MRLGFSQTELAEKLGIHRNSQARYESSEREPEASYLTALEGVGIDAGYVLTGVRDDEDDVYNITVARLFVILCERLGIEFEEREKLILEAFEIEKSTLQLKHGHAIATEQERKLVANLMFKKMGELDLIDISILSQILEGIDIAQFKLGISLTPIKKANLTVVFYQEFKASGQVDQQRIEDAIPLAEKQ